MDASSRKRMSVLAGHFPNPDDEVLMNREPASGAMTSLDTSSATDPPATSAYPGFPQAATATAKFPPPKHDMFFSDDLLTEDEKAVRARTRDFAEARMAPVITQHWEAASFPHELTRELGALHVAGLTIKGYGCPGLSPTAAGMVLAELARVDASVSTFVLVHCSLAALTIAEMGTEEQKNRLLPGLATLDLIGCWALTEPGQGSDAAAMETTATKVPGGWKLSGQKRWIGNGTFADVTVVWARDTDTGKVKAFIVEKGSPGHFTEKIENKIALRCVQNADITLKDCFVPDKNVIPGVKSFGDTAKVLKTSRVMVSWMVVGAAMGVFDMTHRYLCERHQFGVPLAGMAMNQEKLMRMLGGVQASLGMIMRLTRLREEGKMTPGMSSLVKGWVSKQCREVVSLGRELLGGNGIVADFHVAKAFCDMEAMYTYEGTYDINMLVAGRESTGYSAFKTIPPEMKFAN